MHAEIEDARRGRRHAWRCPNRVSVLGEVWRELKGRGANWVWFVICGGYCPVEYGKMGVVNAIDLKEYHHATVEVKRMLTGSGQVELILVRRTAASERDDTIDYDQ